MVRAGQPEDLREESGHQQRQHAEDGRGQRGQAEDHAERRMIAGPGPPRPLVPLQPVRRDQRERHRDDQHEQHHPAAVALREREEAADGRSASEVALPIAAIRYAFQLTPVSAIAATRAYPKRQRRPAGRRSGRSRVLGQEAKTP